MGTSAQEDEEKNAQSVSGLSVGSGDGGAKELGGGQPGTGRSDLSAKPCVSTALRVDERLRVSVQRKAIIS